MRLTTVIVDDEQQALNLIKSYCNQSEQLDVIASFTDALKAMDFINNHRIDLLISDIEMPAISGIELRKNLIEPISTIFITAHSEFAVDGFDLDAIDYLLKPVTFPRFLKAINKSIKKAKTNDQSIALLTQSTNHDFIFVKVDGVRQRIDLRDIRYIESQRDYVMIYVKNKHYLVLQTLTNINQTIKDLNFIRIHRSTIVNLIHVDSIEKDHLYINGVDLSIGKTYRTDLLEKLDM